MKRLILVALLVNAALLAALLQPLRSRERMARAEVGGAGAGVAGSGDVNGSGTIDISDPVYLLNWLFNGGPDPVPCAGGAGSGLPDTGQLTCYLNNGVRCGLLTLDSCFFGQDSANATGCPNDAGRFTLNGDGTVTDTCTGLQWLQETGQTPDEDLDGHPDPIEWCEALLFSRLLVFAGRDDWRLPNARELQSLADYGRSAPAIDPVFRLTGNPSDGDIYTYWTSTSDPAQPSSAFAVAFRNGMLLPGNKMDDQFSLARRYRVLAVRGGN